MRYWKVGNRDDALPYYVLAPNKEMAVKVVEDLMGPINPSRRVVVELPSCPDGMRPAELPIDPVKGCFLEEEEE
jgi:hypothetical protein